MLQLLVSLHTKLPLRHCALATGVVALLCTGCTSTGPGLRNTAAHSNSAAGFAGIDPHYTPEALRVAFADLCNTLRYRPLRVEVDQSEFPFLVYGVLEGRCDYQRIRDAVPRRPGYAYAGSFTAIRSDGSRTAFALNLTPHDVSRADPQRINERLKALGLAQR